jgi:phage shock protein PspC (stress-responsive transcriptional regulator)
MKHTTDHSHKGQGLDGFYDTLRRSGIARASDGRWFAGVSAGLARRLGIDPLVVRAGFILLGMLFGTGLAIYLILWLLMPDESGRISLEQALKHGEGHSIFLLIVTAVVVFGGGPWFGNDSGGGFRFFGFVALAIGTWWFLTRTDAGRDVVRSVRSSVQQATTATSGPPQGDGPGAGPGGSAASGTGSGTGATGAGMSPGNAAANAGASWPAPTGTPIARATTPMTVSVPTPPRERTRGIGFAGGLLVLGAALLAAVGTTRVAEAAGWSGSHLSSAIAAGLGVLGLGILIAGIAGRRSGWLAPLAVLAIGASLLTSVMPRALTEPWSVGERTFTVTTLTADDAYQLGVGSLEVDLSKADYQATPGVDRVTAAVGMGELVLTVPDDVRVTVHAKARAGEVFAHDSARGRQFSSGGTVVDETVAYGPQNAAEQIQVDAEVGLGQITIRPGAAR